MRISRRFPKLFPAAGLVSLLLLAGPASGQLLPDTLAAAASAAGLVKFPDGCDWIEDTRNFAYPETNAHYYRAVIPASRPDGSFVRVRGKYVDVRYFSLQLYDGRLNGIDTLPDYRILPLPGSQSTIASRTALDYAVRPGGDYEVRVLFADKPVNPEPNTLYAGAGYRGRLVLALRHYLEPGATPLPQLSFHDGVTETAFAEPSTSSGCRLEKEARTDSLSQLLGLGTADDRPLPARSPPRPIEFKVYYGHGLLGPSVGVNQDGSYMSASVRKSADLVLVRGRAPSYPLPLGVPVPDVRYWSFCQALKLRQSVVACKADRDTAVDSQGHYHLVIADQSALPALDLQAAGFSFLPFGDGSRAAVIYRQILINPDFPGAVSRVAQDQDPASIIGDYAPVAVYCSPALFAAAVGTGQGAEATFRACANSQ